MIAMKRSVKAKCADKYFFEIAWFIGSPARGLVHVAGPIDQVLVCIFNAFIRLVFHKLGRYGILNRLQFLNTLICTLEK